MEKPLIYLASTSPRRRELLKQIGVPYELINGEVDETAQPAEPAHLYVERLARAKAAAGFLTLQQQGLPSRLVLAADTTVALDDQILGKPATAAEAEAVLAQLSGRQHAVLTAVAISDGERVECAVSVSLVHFAQLGTEAIAAYVATGEPMDKAGSYGAQGKAAMFIERIEGSFSGVIGLPLFETAQLLGRFGYPLP